MSGGLLKSMGKVPAGIVPRRRRMASAWLTLLLVVPALIAALLDDRSQTPPAKDNFELGILPQDRAWLCSADGAAPCSGRDFVRGYGLEGPEYRDFGEVVQERIGTGAWDPKRAVILKEKRKCAEGKDAACRGQVMGL